jgi:hypothetical protein
MTTDNTHSRNEDIDQRIQDLVKIAKETRRDVNEIKLRAFNGLTDTVRETYSKVLSVESKQKSSEERLMELQTSWLDAFRKHDHKERVTLIVSIAALAVIVVAWMALDAATNPYVRALFTASDMPLMMDNAAFPIPSIDWLPNACRSSACPKRS